MDEDPGAGFGKGLADLADQVAQAGLRQQDRVRPPLLQDPPEPGAVGEKPVWWKAASSAGPGSPSSEGKNFGLRSQRVSASQPEARRAERMERAMWPIEVRPFLSQTMRMERVIGPFPPDKISLWAAG